MIMNLSEAQMREKASHYLVYYVDQCPLHEQCLRWLLGPYTDPEESVYQYRDGGWACGSEQHFELG